MFSILSPVIKYLKIKEVSIYNLPFILNSKFTVSILLAFSFLISAKQFFGDPIYCISDKEKNQEFLNNYCWTMGTFIIPQANEKIGRNVISIGISNGRNGSTEKFYLRYYQWVVLILVIQAIAYLIPSFLWKNWEGGRLQQLCAEIGSPIIEENFQNDKKLMLVQYFSSNYRDLHLCYTLKYMFCETLNFVICVLNIIAMDLIFPSFWNKYTSALNSLSLNNWEEWNRHSSKLFPKLTKCFFSNYGPSGSVQDFDALCLLPLNILNEKIFAFLYVWFLFITGLSGLQVIYRFFLIFFKTFRLQLIRAQLRSELTTKEVRKALKFFSFGDWFVLYKVGANINPILYREVVEKLLEVQKIKRITKIEI